MKQYEMKPIKETELGNYPEQDNRVFGVIAKYGIVKTARYFQQRENLRKYLKNPELSQICLYVCDVIEEDVMYER